MAKAPTVPLAEIIMSSFFNNFVLLFSNPNLVIVFSVLETYFLPELKSTTDNQGISPFQYSSIEVLGVPPPITSAISEILYSLHSPIKHPLIKDVHHKFYDYLFLIWV